MENLFYIIVFAIGLIIIGAIYYATLTTQDSIRRSGQRVMDDIKVHNLTCMNSIRDCLQMGQERILSGNKFQENTLLSNSEGDVPQQNMPPAFSSDKIVANGVQPNESESESESDSSSSESDETPQIKKKPMQKKTPKPKQEEDEDAESSSLPPVKKPKAKSIEDVTIASNGKSIKQKISIVPKKTKSDEESDDDEASLSDITKYSVDQLRKMAKKYGISASVKGKPLTKAELYARIKEHNEKNNSE